MTRKYATHCNTLQHTATHCNTLEKFYNVPLRRHEHSEEALSRNKSFCESFFDIIILSRKTYKRESMLQCVLQCVAVCCSVLQIHYYLSRKTDKRELQYPSSNTWFETLTNKATHCNTLQHTATHCNTLINTAIPIL